MSLFRDEHRSIPLNILSVDSAGKPTVDRTAVLSEREKFFPIDTSKPFKLNAGTNGFCGSRAKRLALWLTQLVAIDRVQYTPERLAAIGSEAVKGNSIFSLSDRLGLVHDVMALAKSGYTDLSSALTIVDILRNDKECKAIHCFV
jgi:aminopeptidase 2